MGEVLELTARWNEAAVLLSRVSSRERSFAGGVCLFPLFFHPYCCKADTTQRQLWFQNLCFPLRFQKHFRPLQSQLWFYANPGTRLLLKAAIIKSHADLQTRCSPFSHQRVTELCQPIHPLQSVQDTSLQHVSHCLFLVGFKKTNTVHSGPQPHC